MSAPAGFQSGMQDLVVEEKDASAAKVQSMNIFAACQRGHMDRIVHLVGIVESGRGSGSVCMYVCMYVYVCVCVCVGGWVECIIVYVC